MKNKEIEVLNLFDEPNKRLTREQIRIAINKKDPSGIIRDLVYFEYLIEDNGQLVRTEKAYTEANRKNEKKEENYEIVLNKIFTGSFLEYNLGHEIINFIKDDNNQRYVYLNPWGERNEKAAVNTKFVFHIIESPLNYEQGIYELVAVSKIAEDKESIYNKDTSKELEHSPKFKNHTFYNIFYCGEESGKAHIYTFKAENLYRPNDKRILIKINRDEAKLIEDDNTIIVELMCNPQHSICYADATGKKTFNSNKNENNDVEVLKNVFDNYLAEVDDNLELDDIDDEQCFSIISGRAKLEVSTSNQIAYFLRRDNNLLNKFLNSFLGINDIENNECFEIVREKEKNIDLLFKSKNHIVVVENKIDSNINNVASSPNENGKYNSQLSKYYNYVEDKYSNIPNRSYFILAPEYNGITRRELDEKYESGNFYILKTYNDLYGVLKDIDYKPYGLDATAEGQFLFEQLKKSIEYLTWSNGKQRERTAYIRLKQRIIELNANMNGTNS